MPCIIDKLAMCTSSEEEMKFIDCFIIDIGMLSQQATLPDWNWFAIAKDVLKVVCNSKRFLKLVCNSKMFFAGCTV